MTNQYLLDTHVVIELLTDPDKIPQELVSELRRAVVFVSAASTWEIAIKVSRGKLKIPKNFFHELEQLEFEDLSISREHTQTVMLLSSLHSDPFDRILIAQAMCEELVFVTKDRVIRNYPKLQTRWE